MHTSQGIINTMMRAVPDDEKTPFLREKIDRVSTDEEMAMTKGSTPVINPSFQPPSSFEASRPSRITIPMGKDKDAFTFDSPNSQVSDFTNKAYDKVAGFLGPNPGHSIKALTFVFVATLLYYSSVALEHCQDWKPVSLIPSSWRGWILAGVLTLIGLIPILTYYVGSNATHDMVHSFVAGIAAALQKVKQHLNWLSKRQDSSDARHAETEARLDRLESALSPVSNIKFLRYPVDKNGNPRAHATPYSAVVLKHQMTDLSTGGEILAAARRKKNSRMLFDKWEINKARIREGFEVKYIIQDSHHLSTENFQINIDPEDFYATPKENIFPAVRTADKRSRFDLVVVSIVLERVEK